MGECCDDECSLVERERERERERSNNNNLSVAPFRNIYSVYKLRATVRWWLLTGRLLLKSKKAGTLRGSIITLFWFCTRMINKAKATTGINQNNHPKFKIQNSKFKKVAAQHTMHKHVTIWISSSTMGKKKCCYCYCYSLNSCFFLHDDK